MANYEINLKGEVDPKLKKDLEDVAEAAEAVADSADAGGDSIKELGESAQEKIKDLQNLGKAVAGLRHETNRLTSADKHRKRIAADSAMVQKALAKHISSTTRSTGALTKSTGLLGKATGKLSRSIRTAGKAFAEHNESFQNIFSDGVDEAKQFNAELRHIRNTTKGIAAAFSADMTKSVLGRTKSRVLKGLTGVGAIPQVGAVPDIATPMNRASKAVAAVNSGLERQVHILDQIAEKVPGSEGLALYGVPGRTIREELAWQVANIKKLGEEWKKTKLTVTKYGTILAKVGVGTVPASALPKAISETFAERSANEIRGLVRRFGGGGGGGLPPSGGDRAASDMDKVTRAAKKMDRAVYRGKSTWAQMIVAFNTSYYFFKEMIRNIRAVARVFLDLTDRVIRFENKIRISTITTRDFNKVITSLRATSRETGVGVENIGLTFQRLRIGLDRLALPPEKILGWTQALTRTMAAFGLGANEAGGAIRQFTQGLASGTLRGHELYAVLEQIPPLAQEIAGVMGVFTGDLRALAEKGLIDQDVQMKAMDRLEKRAEKVIKLFQLSPKSLLGVFRDTFGDMMTKFFEQSGGLGVFVGVLKSANQYMADIVDKAREGDPIFMEWSERLKAVGVVVGRTLQTLTAFIGGVAVLRFYNMIMKVIKALKGLGIVGIAKGITGALSSLTGAGKGATSLLGRLAFGGLVGAGIFTLIDQFVENLTERVNDVIDPAVREFKAALEQRSQVIGQTKALTEQLWALRQKDIADLGADDLKEVRKLMDYLRAVQDETRDIDTDFYPVSPLHETWGAELQELRDISLKIEDNISKAKEEAQGLPTRIRNFFKMIEQGAFDSNKEIVKLAKSFERLILNLRMKTGQFQIFPDYLERLKGIPEQYPVEVETKTRKTEEQRIREEMKRNEKTLRDARQFKEIDILEGVEPTGGKPATPGGVPMPEDPYQDTLMKQLGYDKINAALKQAVYAKERLKKIAQERVANEREAAEKIAAIQAQQQTQNVIQLRQRKEVIPQDESQLIMREKRLAANQVALDGLVKELRSTRAKAAADRASSKRQEAQQTARLTSADAAVAKAEEKRLYKMRESTLKAEVARRDLQNIDRMRLIKGNAHLFVEREKRNRAIIKQQEKQLELTRKLEQAETDFNMTLRSMAKDTMLHKMASPSVGGSHLAVNLSPYSFKMPGSDKLWARFDDTREDQLAAIERTIEKGKALRRLVTAKHGDIMNNPITFRDSGKPLSTEQTELVRDVWQRTQAGVKRRDYAQKVRDEVKEANDNAKLLVNTVGTSLVSAFKDVATAAGLFGERWSHTLNTVLDEVSKLIIEYIALNAAQEAASAAYDKGRAGLGDQGDAALIGSQTSITGGKAALGAAAGGPTAALAAAGIAIGGAFLADLLRKRSSREEPKKSPFDDSLARERFRSALVAYTQRQTMIQLQLRTAVAVENAERRLKEAEERARREKSLREAAEIQAYRSFAASHGVRRTPGSEVPPATLSAVPTTLPDSALPVPPRLRPEEIAPSFSLVGSPDQQFEPIRKRHAADTEEVVRRRTASQAQAAAPAAPMPQPAPVNIYTVDSLENAESYARSDKGRAFIMNALEANRDDVKQLLMSG